MNQDIFEWLLLLGRWLHITVAIAWIGTSFFFMWLDRSFEFNKSAKTTGHIGDLWMVHGGGFYLVEKLQMGPVKVPEHLHWFKWESYWTWLSGTFLLILIFYASGSAFLLDSSVSNITYWQAALIGVFTIAGSWIFYDMLWDSALTKKNALMGHLLTLVWFAGATYLLCHTLSGRAAYMHVGAMLGTWMTANVAMRIIPRQRKMVEAAKKGEPLNQDWPKNAKNRSTHNTYFTLPVIFIMISNHFPLTYGSSWNWLILLVLSAAGAAIREYFVVRIAKPARAKMFLAIGLVLIAVTVLATSLSTPASPMASDSAPASAPVTGGATVKGVIHFTGEVPHGEKLTLPLPCTKTHKGETFSNEILVQDGKLKNTIVRVVKGLEGRAFTDIPAETVKIDQNDCMYEPRVAAVRVGQKVEFINSDETFHNVRSITKNNENFNDAMPNKNDTMIKSFAKPEFFVQTKCSVHPWMSATIAVMDHPFFSVSHANGEYEIRNLPPGHYTLEAWHEIFGTQTLDIDVKGSEPVAADFTFHK